MIKKIIKSLPIFKKFIQYHNPELINLIDSSGIVLSKDSIIIDVGASVGITIDYFLQFEKDINIYSFEPTSDLVFLLKNKYIDQPNIKIFDIALSDRIGEIEFYTSEFSYTNSIYKPNIDLYNKYNDNLAELLSKSKIQKCKLETFTNWYNENLSGQTIDLMKIDVQGSEYEVLNGGIEVIRDNVKAIAIELQYLPFYEKSVPFYEQIKLLYDNNFFIYSYYDFNKMTNNQLLENNALLLNKKFYSEILKKK